MERKFAADTRAPPLGLAQIMERIVVPDIDPRLLKAVRERDQERQERIRITRVAQALKLQNEKLRREVRQLTADGAVRVNQPGFSQGNPG
jgi:hypothetical protein